MLVLSTQITIPSVYITNAITDIINYEINNPVNTDCINHKNNVIHRMTLWTSDLDYNIYMYLCGKNEKTIINESTKTCLKYKNDILCAIYYTVLNFSLTCVNQIIIYVIHSAANKELFTWNWLFLLTYTIWCNSRILTRVWCS